MESLANSTYNNFKDIPIYDSVEAILNRLSIKPQHYMQLIYNLTSDGSYTYGDGWVHCTDGGTYEVKTMQILTEFGLCYVCNTFLGLEYSSRFVLFGEYPIAKKIDFSNLGFKQILDNKVGNFHDKEIALSFYGFAVDAIDVCIARGNKIYVYTIISLFRVLYILPMKS